MQRLQQRKKGPAEGGEAGEGRQQEGQRRRPEMLQQAGRVVVLLLLAAVVYTACFSSSSVGKGKDGGGGGSEENAGTLAEAPFMRLDAESAQALFPSEYADGDGKGKGKGKTAGSPFMPAKTLEAAPVVPHLQLDRLVYRPGTTLYGSLWTLHRTTQRPVGEDGTALPNVVVKNGKGDAVATLRLTTTPSSSSTEDRGRAKGKKNNNNEDENEYRTATTGTAGFSWNIPGDLAGGEYSVQLDVDSWWGTPMLALPRNFTVLNVRPPTLNLQVAFTKETYGPGDDAEAHVHLLDDLAALEGKASRTLLRSEARTLQADLQWQATVDGAVVQTGSGKLDILRHDHNDRAGMTDKGGTVRFSLPREYRDSASGQLSVTVNVLGLVETTVRPIPLVDDHVIVEAFPESGYAVHGLQTRLFVQSYFRNLEPAGVTLDVCRATRTMAATSAPTDPHRGEDESGWIVHDCFASIQTRHEGRGVSERFVVPPELAGGTEQLVLKLVSPRVSGKPVRVYPLPNADIDSAIMKALLDDHTPSLKEPPAGADGSSSSGGGKAIAAGVVSAEGAIVLASDQAVYPFESPIVLTVAASRDGMYQLELSAQSRRVTAQPVQLRAGKVSQVSFDPSQLWMTSSLCDDARWNTSPAPHWSSSARDPEDGVYFMGNRGQKKATQNEKEPACNADEQYKLGNGDNHSATTRISPHGVLRATLYRVVEPPKQLPQETHKRAWLLPLAERLAFREAPVQETPTVTVELDQSVAEPGSTVRGQVRLAFPDAGDAGATLPDAVAVVAVTEDRWTGAATRPRDQHPRLPQIALLEHETAGSSIPALADPYAYLQDKPSTNAHVLERVGGPTKANSVSSTEAIHLLLGTQGWRRFAFDNVFAFVQAEGAQRCPGATHAQRIVCALLQTPSSTNHLDFGLDLAMADAEMMPLGGGFAMMRAGGARPRMKAMVLEGAGRPVAAEAVALENDGAEEQNDDGGAVDEMQMRGEAGASAGAPPPPKAAAAPRDAADMAGDDQPVAMAMRRIPFHPPKNGIVPMGQQRPTTALPSKRIYAHSHRTHSADSNAADLLLRHDFTPTLYWTAGQLATKASESTKVAGASRELVLPFAFDTSDSLTTFRVSVDVASSAGRHEESASGSGTAVFSAADAKFQVSRSVSLNAKLPTWAMVGDTVVAPVNLIVRHPPQAQADGSNDKSKSRSQSALSDAVRSGNAVIDLSSTLTAGLSSASLFPGDAASRLPEPLQQHNAGSLALQATLPASTTTVHDHWYLQFLVDHATMVSSTTRTANGQVQTSAARPVPERVSAVARVSSSKGGGGAVEEQRAGHGMLAADAVQHDLALVPQGFPVEAHQSEVLQVPLMSSSPPAEWSIQIDVDGDAVANSMEARLDVYPSPVSRLGKALEALIRRPCGCFEQTSATTYPMTLALRYMKQDPSLRSGSMWQKGMEHLADGYKRLTGFEVEETGGFEWFGNSPAHESLTAYGVLQFMEMKQLAPDLVSDDLISRALEWLLSRREEDAGGFMQSNKRLDSFGGTPKRLTDLYIIYSLVRAGVDRARLENEIQYITNTFDDVTVTDTYELALASATMYKLGDRQRGKAYATRLLSAQQEDGHVVDASTSITMSRGSYLDMETTSVAILAWIEDNSFSSNAERAIRWLASQCSEGRFGSTQSTILALQAILAYETQRRGATAPVRLQIEYDGRTAADLVVQPTDDVVSVDVANIIPMPTGGNPVHGVVKVTASADTTSSSPARSSSSLSSAAVALPVSMSLRYNSMKPVAVPDSALSASVEFVGVKHETMESNIRQAVMTEGDIGRLVVKVAAKSDGVPPQQQQEGQAQNQDKEKEKDKNNDQGIPMVVASVGIPAGLRVEYDSLLRLKRAGDIAHFEVGSDGTVSLYWYGIRYGQELEAGIFVSADIPGSYTSKPSTVFGYYSPTDIAWADPVRVLVKPLGA